MNSAHLFVAAVYDAIMVPADKMGFEQVRKMVTEHAAGSVLEIGAGTGLNFKFFDKAGCVFAIEPDPYMLSHARKRLEGCAALMRAYAEWLPFPDDSFDTVVSTLTFCTIGEPVLAARETNRVLKPTGTFYFAEHPVADKNALAYAERMLTPIWRKLAGGCNLDRNIVSFFTSGGLVVREFIRLDSFFVAGKAVKGTIQNAEGLAA